MCNQRETQSLSTVWGQGRETGISISALGQVLPDMNDKAVMRVWSGLQDAGYCMTPTKPLSPTTIDDDAVTLLQKIMPHYKRPFIQSVYETLRGQGLQRKAFDVGPVSYPVAHAVAPPPTN